MHGEQPAGALSSKIALKLAVRALLDPITAAFDSHMKESCVETSPASVGISTDTPVLFP
jgi:hypothetical protein